MSITVKPSQKFGGNGGTSLDDFGIIMNDSSFNGINIKKILIRKVEAQCGIVVDSIQITYYLETIKGAYEFPGNKYGGSGGELGDKLVYIFTDDDQVTGISGRYGPYIGTDDNIISNLKFHTSQNNTINCGNSSTNRDTSFTLPVGVFYGNSGNLVDSIGTYEISEPILTTLPSQSTIVALSCTTGILGFCLLIITGIFLWKEFRKQKAVPAPPLAND
ncbi:hypothetical protein RclHR1_15990002 [Rhizophagus clarus]|uniref:Jacalin-type lectin domain-containing protein n=1 Tax=Rhizophagus clarus TaxID=94130 RepID=A0A2Z6QKL5_9GLOM|nr:hypothetical protein RclHR1_15990002 [Rhizophagus clarus]